MTLEQESDQSAVAGAIERLTHAARTIGLDQTGAINQATVSKLDIRTTAAVLAAQALRIKALEDGLREAKSGFTSLCGQLNSWGHEPYLNWRKITADIDALLGSTEGRDDG